MFRDYFLAEITKHFRVHPICAILGPRQVGKTVLARMFIEQTHPSNISFFDLENPTHLALFDNPMLALSSLPHHLIVIDEIQRRPELFPILRVLVDQPHNQQRFLILGSASKDLIRQSSESLAGRIGYIELPPFSLTETKNSRPLWVRGGFPRSYLAQSDADSYMWRQSYITTFLEQDIPNLGFNIPSQQMRRLWLMLAHYHGQIFHTSELSRSLGISDHLVRKYLDILAGTYMVRLLSPWFENIHKRQVKSPKVYFRDSGILHALLGITDTATLHTYPKLGLFWEGFALEEVIRATHASPQECYFWATHADAELDLLLVRHTKRFGFEFKYTESPKITKSMNIAIQDLKLDHLAIIYPGNTILPLSHTITAYGLETITTGEFLSIGM